MGTKIDAAIDAVRPGSACRACVIVAGSDLNSIRSVFGREYKPEYGSPKGTLFATPGSNLYTQAESEVMKEDVSRMQTLIFVPGILFFSSHLIFVPTCI